MTLLGSYHKVESYHVDDIIFYVTNKSLYKKFTRCMQNVFVMSMIGEINLFIGLQIKHTRDDIFINQSNHIKDLLKGFRME